MIKKLLFAFAFIACTNCFAQDVSVEKSIYGIQTGLVGVWFNNEVRLSNQIALRGEIGLELIAVGSASLENDETYYVIAPEISIEPRWYYNLAKRSAKGRNIKKNSGNIFSIRTLYFPDSFLISNSHDIDVANQIAIIPKWGIRRVYGNHFTFETGFGLGPTFAFGKHAENMSDKQDIFVDAHVRIGYTF